MLLGKLDDSGIVYIGAEVDAETFSSVKSLPKEKRTHPEEKLLRAIFGEKASDVKDTSLRVPTSVTGTVIDVQVFTRDGLVKDDRAKEIEKSQLRSIRKDIDDEYRIIEGATLERLRNSIVGKVVAGGPKIKKGQKITVDYLDKIEESDLLKLRMANDKLNEQIQLAADQLEERGRSSKKDLRIKRIS